MYTSPSIYKSSEYTKSDEVLTADKSWEKSFPHIGLDSFPYCSLLFFTPSEAKLDQAKNSREFREKEILNNTVGIRHMQSWLQKYAQHLQNYTTVSGEVGEDEQHEV